LLQISVPLTTAPGAAEAGKPFSSAVMSGSGSTLKLNAVSSRAEPRPP
jgi:hypothetical protein